MYPLSELYIFCNLHALISHLGRLLALLGGFDGFSNFCPCQCKQKEYYGIIIFMLFIYLLKKKNQIFGGNHIDLVLLVFVVSWTLSGSGSINVCCRYKAAVRR